MFDKRRLLRGLGFYAASVASFGGVGLLAGVLAMVAFPGAGTDGPWYLHLATLMGVACGYGLLPSLVSLVLTSRKLAPAMACVTLSLAVVWPILALALAKIDVRLPFIRNWTAVLSLLPLLGFLTGVLLASRLAPRAGWAEARVP